MTIVDLDVAPRTAARPPRMVPSRSLALFVIGLLTLVLVTASAPPAAQFGAALWSAPFDRDNDSMTLTPTSLFLFQHGAHGPVLTAYDLATGRCGGRRRRPICSPRSRRWPAASSWRRMASRNTSTAPI